MSQQVLIPGLDPTAFTAIDGAQLATIVNTATFASGIGGVIVTQDSLSGVPNVPNASSDTTLQTYIWVRLGNPNASSNANSGGTCYFWDANSPNPTNPTQLLYWNPIVAGSIAPASIQGYQIASNTIPATALEGGISASQVVGLSTLFNTALTSTSTPATGAISGSFGAGFQLANQPINSSSLFVAGVLNSYTLFSGQVILPSYLDTVVSAAPVSAVMMAPVGIAGNAAWTSKAIISMAEPTTAQAGYLPTVQSNGTVSWNAPASQPGLVKAQGFCTVNNTSYTSISSITYTGGGSSYIVALNSSGATLPQLNVGDSIYCSGFVSTFVKLAGNFTVLGTASTPAAPSNPTTSVIYIQLTSAPGWTTGATPTVGSIRSINLQNYAGGITSSNNIVPGGPGAFTVSYGVALTNAYNILLFSGEDGTNPLTFKYSTNTAAGFTAACYTYQGVAAAMTQFSFVVM
jgi:hypothetical protein